MLHHHPSKKVHATPVSVLTHPRILNFFLHHRSTGGTGVRWLPQ